MKSRVTGSRKAEKPRTGIWLIGARGAVATTTMVGVAAAARGLVPLQGVTTEGPRGEGLRMPAPAELVFGGWEIRNVSLVDSARCLSGTGGIFDPRLVTELEDDLESIDEEIVTGGTLGIPPPVNGTRAHESPEEVVTRLRDDLERFRTRNALERIVVVNLSTTEPLFALSEEYLTLTALEEVLFSERPGALRASTVYAYAAMREGAAFVNFAASPSALVPAIRWLAEREGVPFMGTDGKTGETLVKSALAPLFLERDLKVLAWHGDNVLGNGDGQALDRPEIRAAKVETKDGVVRDILGYTPHTSINIGYVPSLGDWKTAWDLIHFEGFLGTRMTMQFTWQGSDSILAAPLVVDLARLGDLALRREETGPMVHASCFFKSPVGTKDHELARQYERLDTYLRRARISVAQPQPITQRGSM